MTLFSPSFALLFLVTALTVYALPSRRRWLALLTASLVYGAAWGGISLGVLLVCTGVVYVAGLRLGRTDGRARAAWLILGIGTPLAALTWFRLNPNAAQPVGLSFYALALIGYPLDVHHRRLEPEGHPGRFALFGGFFLPLASGPIGRAATLLPQLAAPRPAHPERFTLGLRLILWGAFKKLVVADRLGLYVDAIFAAPEAAHPLQLLFATYFFAFQIYFDFSAYSDIIVGAARLLGLDLIQNFRRPYLAASIQEFWARWHISLTTWFRDYLYLPLVRRRLKRGGNAQSLKLTDYHLLLIFFLSGLWHGIGWTFAVWGALHGLYLLAANWRAAWVARRGAVITPPSGWRRAVAVFVTFHLVLLAWVFFRADSMGQALTILSGMARWAGQLDLSLLTGILYLRGTLIALGGIAFILAAEIWAERRGAADMAESLSALPRHIRWAGYYAIALAILLFGIFANSTFLYFRF